MELRPSIQDIADRNRHIKAQEVATEQQAAEEQRKELEKQATEERRQQYEQYRDTLRTLEDAAIEIPAGAVSIDTNRSRTLRATATPWVPLVNEGASDNLSAECRLLGLDTLSTWPDRSNQTVNLRSYNRFIELRWRDDSTGYVGQPQRIVRIDDDAVSFIEGSGTYTRPFALAIPSIQAELRDFIDTILTPMVAGLERTNADPESEPLPIV